jgi:glycosyltransferase involved in cell wall biosynthesis
MIAVVVPCYRVVDRVLSVLSGIGPEVDAIFCVDDACPDHSGELILRECTDSRVTVITHERNRGVGGAVITGYRAALKAGATVVVKIDGDYQMDPGLIPCFTGPILNGRADYTKGNRFTKPGDLRGMPAVRLFGNSVLSLFIKFSSGYWNVLDPTNGYTAIHADVLRRLPLDRVSERYFFESDLLFHLRMIDAVVMDMPITAKYDGESSSLRWWKVLPGFILRSIRNSFVRLFYSYLIKDFSLATLMLILGFMLLTFGSIFGVIRWLQSISTGISASAGTVMLAGLPVIIGLQLLLGFLGYDISSVPRTPLSSLKKN